MGKRIVTDVEEFKSLEPGTYTVAGDAAKYLVEQQMRHFERVVPKRNTKQKRKYKEMQDV